MAKRGKEPALEPGIEKPVDPLLDAPAEVNPLPVPAQVEAAPAPSGPTFGERVARFFRFLLRLVLVFVVLTVIGVGLYLGLPWLYQRYVVPVEQNTAEMRELRSQQEQTVQELTDLQTRLETLETMQNQHDQSLTELDGRVTEIETEVAARTRSLAALEERQSELQTQNESSAAELERQIKLLKSMELLSRARLFMYQSNFGLAKQDVQIARDLLGSIEPADSGTLREELGVVLFRLDLTLSSLPDFPVAASDDLDIAWQILLSGLPQETPTLPATPTAAGTASPTPSPANATVTATLVATVQPSTTP